MLGRSVNRQPCGFPEWTTDEHVISLMPINRKFPLAALLDACRNFPLQSPHDYHRVCHDPGAVTTHWKMQKAR
jgi:adenine C2-methylase RlmN of 23S rRNA A2503 and tRNA A37